MEYCLEKRKLFSILFFIFGVFYLVMIAISIRTNNLINAIFCAVMGIIVFFICFYIAYDKS
jgi:succinate-acetate transporter protein